jgi:hypothetical protein
MDGDCAAGIYRSSDALASHASDGHDAAVVVSKLGRFSIATARSVRLEWWARGQARLKLIPLAAAAKPKAAGSKVLARPSCTTDIGEDIMSDKPFLGLVVPFVPAAGWIRAYKAKEFPTDLVTGLSLAAFVIPESLAYASLAQLPPVTGLYRYLPLRPPMRCPGRVASSRSARRDAGRVIDRCLGDSAALRSVSEPSRTNQGPAWNRSSIASVGSRSLAGG